jgi:hypothetical protein
MKAAQEAATKGAPAKERKIIFSLIFKSISCKVLLLIV